MVITGIFFIVCGTLHLVQHSGGSPDMDVPLFFGGGISLVVAGGLLYGNVPISSQGSLMTRRGEKTRKAPENGRH